MAGGEAMHNIILAIMRLVVIIYILYIIMSLSQSVHHLHIFILLKSKIAIVINTLPQATVTPHSQAAPPATKNAPP